MTVQLQIISPLDDEVNVPTNTEIVFRVYSDVPTALSSIDVTVDSGDGAEAVFSGLTSSGFLNSWSGEVFDTNGDYTDMTLVLIRPTIKPIYPSGREIKVHIDSTEV